MMKSIFAAFFFCILAPAFTEVFDHPLTRERQPTFQKVSRAIAAHDIQKGSFTQTKHISRLQRNLTSSGFYVISKNDGIMWQTKKPFPSTMIVSASSIVQISASGKKNLLQTAGNATFESFAKVIASVFQGGNELSEKNFDLYFEGREGSWSLGLIPKDKAIRAVAEKFVLEGGDFLQSVTMHEKNGDFVRYDFAGVTFPVRLTDDEKAIFERQ